MGTKLLAGTLLVLLAVAPAAVATSGPPGGDVHLAMDLADGGLLTGMGPDGVYALHSRWGRLEFPLSDVEGIDFHEDGETATVSMQNGDVIRGVLEPATFEIRPAGGEARTVDAPALSALRVTPPIHFAGSMADAWEVTFDGVRGWTTENGEDGRLVVSDVAAVASTTADRGRWSRIHVGRSIPALGDFELSAEISWDSTPFGRRAMQEVYVALLDDAENVITAVGHRDAWVVSSGSGYSQLPGVADTWGTGENSQPLIGGARLGIDRHGRDLLVSWDGVVVHEGESAAKVSRVEVHFGFYDYRGDRGPSRFGTVSVDRLKLRRESTVPPSGRFRHSVVGIETGTISFKPGGRIDSPEGTGRWTRRGRDLVLTWPRADAPGGVWVDRLTLSPSGESYSGTNQAGSEIRGERLSAVFQFWAQAGTVPVRWYGRAGGFRPGR